MILNAKISPAPTRLELVDTLGTTDVLWEQVRRVLNRECIPLTEEWVYSGRRHGWALRFRNRQRVVLYLKPLDQYFRATVALDAKAVSEARNRPLPDTTLARIDKAEQYEGDSVVRLDVRGGDDMLILEQLIAITMECSARAAYFSGHTSERATLTSRFEEMSHGIGRKTKDEGTAGHDLSRTTR